MLTLPVRAGWGRFTIPRMVSRQRRPCCLAGVHQSVSRSWRPRVPSTSTPSAMGVPRVCSRARSRPRSARHGATRGWTACARQPVAWPGRRQSAAPLLPWTGVRGWALAGRQGACAGPLSTREGQVQDARRTPAPWRDARVCGREEGLLQAARVPPWPPEGVLPGERRDQPVVRHAVQAGTAVAREAPLGRRAQRPHPLALIAGVGRRSLEADALRVRRGQGCRDRRKGPPGEHRQGAVPPTRHRAGAGAGAGAVRAIPPAPREGTRPLWAEGGHRLRCRRQRLPEAPSHPRGPWAAVVRPPVDRQTLGRARVGPQPL